MMGRSIQPRKVTPMTWRERLAPRWFMAMAGLLLLVASLVAIPMATRAGAAATPAPACPANWTCTNLPNNGGQIQVGPTQDVAPVGSTQPWVLIRGYGLQPGSYIRVHYCDLTQGLTVAPQCVNGSDPNFIAPSTTTMTVFSDGTVDESTQVPLNDPSGGIPFSAKVPGTNTTGSFYCDGGAMVCGIVVTDSDISSPYTLTPNPRNSLAFPISFNLAAAACPSKQTLVTSESEFGIGPLLPQVDRKNCAASGQAYNLFNTEQSGDTAVHDLYQNVRNTSSSAVRVAFTPDPWSPNQAKYLPAGHFVAIPITLTATSMAFQGTIYDGNGQYNTTKFNLSPNMVAGIMTGHYSNTTQTDPANCIGSCPRPPCFNAVVCSLLQLATVQPGYTIAAQLGAFPLAYPSGITDQLTSWICNAPLGKVPSGGNIYTELLTPAESFIQGLTVGGHPVTACPQTNMWPAENISGAWWSAGVSPLDQTKALYAAVPNPGSGASNPASGFAPMPLSWSDYLGYSNAGLLNAAGVFQTPTQDAVYAALADSTYNSDGTLKYNYSNTTDTKAYSMPMVIYAVVSTDTMPAAQKTAIQNALTSVLDTTGGSSVADLPPGYFPLTSDLYKQATAEVATAIGNPNFKITDVLPQLASSSNSGSGTGTYPSSFSPVSSANSYGLLQKTLARAASRAFNAAKVPSSSPLYGTLLLTSSSSRMLVPTVILLGILAMALGAIVLLWGSIVAAFRRLRPSVASPVEPEETVGDA
jgi:hypothetical protein